MVRVYYAVCNDRYILKRHRKKINSNVLTDTVDLNLIGRVTRSVHHTILDETEGPVAEVLNPHGRAPICLVCEHASAFVPASLNELGILPQHQKSHAAWDIGALDLSKALSQTLDAPLVAARVSRLVYDCNRPPEAHDAILERSEIVNIPRNTDLTDAEKTARVTEIYEPFHAQVSDTLDAFAQPPVLVTVHSFTRVWNGKTREVELGILHDRDDRLAQAMFQTAPTDIDTRLNEPYSAMDGVTHTLQRHAIPRGLQNVMIEVRNDLISDPGGVARFTAILTDMLTTAVELQVSS